MSHSVARRSYCSATRSTTRSTFHGTTRSAPARALPVVLLALALHGCATRPPGSACRAGETAAAHDLLYFGTARASGTVTAAEWAAFLEDTVTPRFAQGLTTWDAAGQWRRDDGRIIHEATHVLSILHPDDAANDRAMGDLVAAYRARFQQDAVLRVRSAACMSV